MVMYSGFSFTEETLRRQNYVQQEIGKGFPVIAMTYKNGIVLVTKSTEIIEKVSSIDKGLAFAGVGNYYHIRKIRDTLDNITKKTSVGSNNKFSAKEILKHKDGLENIIGSAYHNIYEAPYLVDVILVECSGDTRDNAFYRVDFTGRPYKKKNFIICGGTEKEDNKGTKQKIEEYIRHNGKTLSSFEWDDAVKLSIDALTSSITKEEVFIDESNDEILCIGILEKKELLKQLGNDELSNFYEYLKGR